MDLKEGSRMVILVNILRKAYKYRKRMEKRRDRSDWDDIKEQLDTICHEETALKKEEEAKNLVEEEET